MSIPLVKQSERAIFVGIIDNQQKEHSDNMEQKQYTSPRTRVVLVKAQTIICQSVTGSFGVSDSDVEKGNDSVWGRDLDW